MTAGYSGTPLAQKLGFARGMRVWFQRMPETVRVEIDPEALGIDEQASATGGMPAALIFATERQTLEREIHAVRPLLATSGFLWVAWPKKAAKVSTDITEDVVREIALPTGMVDIKVCAIDEIWSGLKLVIRKELR